MTVKAFIALKSLVDGIPMVFVEAEIGNFTVAEVPVFVPVCPPGWVSMEEVSMS
jgi:hypothetical protein